MNIGDEIIGDGITIQKGELPYGTRGRVMKIGQTSVLIRWLVSNNFLAEAGMEMHKEAPEKKELAYGRSEFVCEIALPDALNSLAEDYSALAAEPPPRTYLLAKNPQFPAAA